MSPTMAEDRRLCDVRLAPALSLTYIEGRAGTQNQDAVAVHPLEFPHLLPLVHQYTMASLQLDLGSTLGCILVGGTFSLM